MLFFLSINNFIAYCLFSMAFVIYPIDSINAGVVELFERKSY